MAANVSASTLVEAQVLADKMWADSQRKADFIPEVKAANAIIQNTTAKIDIVATSEKKMTAKIKWNKFCDTTVGTGAPDYCAFTGAEADSATKTYVIDTQAHGEFTINEADYHDNFLDFPAVFAENLLKVKKNVEEKIAQSIIAKVQSFASDNLNQVTGIACPDTGADWSLTYIPAAHWAPSIIGYFLKTARLNKFTAPFLLDGKNLYDHYWAAQMNAGNGEGKGAKTMFDQMKYYEDIVNIEAVAAGSTFMIERGTVAFASKAWWEKASAANPIMDAGDRMKYSEKSKNIPGLTFDIYIRKECSGKYNKYHVLVDANYGVYNGASSCNDATGILEFTCGACPA